MNLQIKKRSLKNNIIDGSKVLFLNDDSFKKLKNDGSVQEVFSVSSENKVEFQIPVHVAADPTVDSEVANKHYVDSLISQQGSDQSQINDSLQTQIDSLPTPIQLEKIIDSTILSNGYFELSDSIDSQAIMIVSDIGTVLLKDIEYTASIVNGVTRISFSSDLLVGGEKALEIGEKVYLFYFPISGTSSGSGGLSASDVVINTMSGNQTLMSPSVNAVKEYVDESVSNVMGTVSPQFNTLGKIQDQISEVLPKGVIFPFAGSVVPSGFLLCDGSLLNREVYASLFTAIGTLYGAGDGTTTFKLPDLRGQFIRGLDAGKGLDPNRTLGSSQLDSTALPRNTFTMQTESAGTHTHTFSYYETSGGSGDQNASGSFFGGVDTSTGNQSSEIVTLNSSGVHTHNIRIGRDIVGYPHYPNGGDTETRPYNIALNYIIKY